MKNIKFFGKSSEFRKETSDLKKKVYFVYL